MKKTTGLIGLLALACATAVAAAASAAAAPAGRGAVALRNVQTGLCLDGDFGGKVYTKGCGSDNPYQHWYLHEGPMGVMLQSSKTGLCITGKGVGNDSIAAVACNSGDVKQWWEQWNVNGNAYTLLNHQNRKALDSDAKGNAHVHQYGDTNPYQHWSM
ncbi:ricin-type beta-trefoil lectin domain protein [Streptomyces goshikiensis]|uniref:RICIN domain-containing protein n=1 Tax=Streptomyces goshikiensis TaxID=1942 RepID=UPI0033EE8A1F